MEPEEPGHHYQGLLVLELEEEPTQQQLPHQHLVLELEEEPELRMTLGGLVDPI